MPASTAVESGSNATEGAAVDDTSTPIRSKRALASVKAKVKAITQTDHQQTLDQLIHRLNPALRGWCAYFRPGVSSRTFNYLRTYTWRRVVRWLRRKHEQANWRWLRRRYLPGWWPTDGNMVLFNAGSVGTTRYRYRGNGIPTPWESQAGDRGRVRAARSRRDAGRASGPRCADLMQRIRSRNASSARVGTNANRSSPAASSRTRRTTARLSVLTRSPEPFGIDPRRHDPHVDSVLCRASARARTRSVRPHTPPAPGAGSPRGTRRPHSGVIRTGARRTRRSHASSTAACVCARVHVQTGRRHSPAMVGCLGVIVGRGARTSRAATPPPTPTGGPSQIYHPPRTSTPTADHSIGSEMDARVKGPLGLGRFCCWCWGHGGGWWGRAAGASATTTVTLRCAGRDRRTVSGRELPRTSVASRNRIDLSEDPPGGSHRAARPHHGEGLPGC